MYTDSLANRYKMCCTIFIIISVRLKYYFCKNFCTTRVLFSQIMQYDLIPRYNIYMVDDSFMTVQSYAYGRGEDTPTFVLRRREPHGLFEFYASVARYILEHARPTN